MGRPRLPLACSICKRTPDEVRLHKNRYCVDCMRAYNKEYRLRRDHETTEGKATIELLPDTDELVGSEDAY